MDEAHLVEQARAGDQQAFAELFHRYLTAAWRVAYTITGDSHAADDAVQEAFIIAYHRLGNVAPGARFGPWFHAIAANCARRQARRAVWKRWLPLLAADSVADAAARESLDAAETRGEVWEAVRRLPVDLRVVVALRYVLDMSEVDMAAALGLPAGTIKSRLHRARRLLQEWLGAEPKEEGLPCTIPTK
ncbi:MAG: RNA polymerase sigma factor [Bacillota bacterium]